MEKEDRAQGLNTKRSAFFSKEALASIPWLLGGKTATFFLYFAISVVIVRGLAVSEYGTYSLLLSIGEYVNLFCALGLNYAMLRFIPELMSAGNIFGLKRLFLKSFLSQLAAFMVCSGILFLFRNPISQIMHIEFSHYLIFLLTIMLMFLVKEFVNNSLTALYRSRLLSILSIVQGFTFLLLLLTVRISGNLSIETAILSYSFSIFLISIVPIITLFQLQIYGRQRSAKNEIGWNRLLSVALPTMGGNALSRLLEQYSEIFFLGYFTSTMIVGYYSLGVFLPHIVITFIPLTIHSLLTAAVSEAYSKDKRSLPDLVYGVYEILIFICVPIAVFGLFFSAKMIHWIYGAKMMPSAPIASFFFAFKLLSLFWIPLSTAITAQEKVRQVLWLEFLPIIVNLPLDYFLIKNYGMLGAVLAVSIAFGITFPIKVKYLKKMIGGIYFPYSFFLRILLTAVGISIVYYAVFWNTVSWGLLIAALSYGFVFLAVLKIFRLIRTKDIEKYKHSGIPAFTRVLEYLANH